MSRSRVTEQPPPSRLIHYTPLRYPGGKAKLAGFAKKIIEVNGLNDGTYVEPYLGSSIALNYSSMNILRVYINDISRPSRF